MSREDHHHEEEFEEEWMETAGHVRPSIYDSEWQESMPDGFDAVTIHLDGRMQSDLDWKKEINKAHQAVEKGYSVMWNLHMGLFDGLTQSLKNQGQFLSLTLAVEYFRDVVWKEFKSSTVGVILFKGLADFSQGFPWDRHQEENLRNWLQEMGYFHLNALGLTEMKRDEEGSSLLSLYCRDVAIEYLALLASRLPDSLPTYLFLDTHLLSHSYLRELQGLNPERYERFTLALKGNKLPFDAIGWDNPTAYGYSGHTFIPLPAKSVPLVGICIPPTHFYHPSIYMKLEEGISALIQKSVVFKLIAESHLTAQWDGLDYLFVCPLGLTSQGKRKLQGFCAAGGIVVSMGEEIGLPHEISLMDYLSIFTVI